MPSSVLVVVAKYREDGAWTRDLGLPVLVYDKSGDPLPGAIPLPNLGREAHTYLQHILTHYPDFPDCTAFVQGNPFAHLDPEGAAGVAELRALIEEAVARRTPFRGLAWFRLLCDGLGRPHDMCDPAKKGRWAGWGRDIPVAEVYAKLFATPAPKAFIASACTGNFLVSRSRILARPREFYAFARDLVLADPLDAHNTGHAFERLWQVVFNGNAALSRTAYGPA